MKTLITSTLIAIMIGTAATAPASAQENNNFAGAIAGLVALGILAKAIDDRQERDRARSAAAARARTNLSSPSINTLPDTWGRLGEQRTRRDRRISRLPEQCQRRVETDNGNRRAFSRRCLNRNYAYVDQLPSQCERRVQTRRGHQTVYGARCLKRNGFRIEARRDID
jgi:hypothetical protein